MIAPEIYGETHAGSVAVASLSLSQYRCYEHITINCAPDAPLKILTGPNGAGKTNLLEAISFLAPGRGLRGASLGDIRRHQGGSPWAVSCLMALGDEEIRVGTGLDPEQGGGEQTNRRIVRVDGETVKSSNQLGDRWGILWLTPQMDRLFIEGPSSRRRFLDRLVLGLYPDHSREVSAFERAMRERNRLIADQGRNADSAWLSALEARMAEHGVAVAARRVDFAEQLAGQLAAQPDGPFPRAELAIDGWVEGLVADGLPLSEIELAYRRKLADNRSTELSLGKSASIGVHKTDLIVTHAPKNMPAELCSTGEQKALLIAIILANAMLQKAIRGRPPLMLLDEVAAHLDEERRRGLFSILTDIGSQCWLTGTDRVIFDGLGDEAEFYCVEEGKIRSH